MIEAAVNVKKIFQLYLQGNGYKKIVKNLKTNKVLNPSAYRSKKNNVMHFLRIAEDEYSWNTQAIDRILTDIIYLGTLELRKKELISYKSSRQKTIPKSERAIFFNAHKAIVTKEEFDLAQKIRKSKQVVRYLNRAVSFL